MERVGTQDCLRRAGRGPEIQSAPSADRCVSSLQRSSPSWPEKACRVLASRPGAAQISSPVSWFTTMTRYLCPRL